MFALFFLRGAKEPSKSPSGPAADATYHSMVAASENRLYYLVGVGAGQGRVKARSTTEGFGGMGTPFFATVSLPQTVSYGYLF